MWLIPPAESSKSVPAPEPSASASPALLLMLARSATSNEKHIRPSAWSRLWKQETWIRRLSGWVTSAPSPRTAGQDWWTRSQRPSLARATASLEHEAASMTRDGSGLRLGVSYASYDPATSSWRTSLASQPSLWGEPSEPSSVTWTRSGTTRSGAAYQRPKLAPPSAAIDSGSSRGGVPWPRPRANVQRSSRRAMVEIAQWSKPNIEQFAELAMGILPREFHSTDELTPQARTVYEAGQRLWARPSAGNFNDSETPESFHARRLKTQERHQNGNGFGTSLAIQAKETAGRLWMRPRAGGRHAFRGGDRSSEPLLPGQAVETTRRLSLTGPRCPTTTQVGEPSSTPDLSSLRLSPWFDEWLLYGRALIGWTCVCPARALARVVAGSPRSATPSVPTRPQPLSEPSGSVPSMRCRNG